MNTNSTSATLAASATVAAISLSAAEKQSVEDLIARIKNTDDKVRGPAWQSAGTFGAPTVKPLARLMTDPDLEAARAARRGLWKIVRHAGRPDADNEKQAVATELIGLLDGQPTPVRREVLWMLSEIGDNAAVKPIAASLTDRDTREAARAALERIPGEESVAALKAGLASVAEDFKPAVAQSLRVRGVTVTGYPSQKLVPTRPVGAGAAKTA